MKIEIWSDVVCPWCYVNDRKYGIPGAQPAEVFLGALRKAHAGRD